MLASFLGCIDVKRAERTFEKLSRHNISAWILTGGLATEIHHVLHGRQPALRALNDIDFITASFHFLPESLARDYLFRHVHPADPPNKTILQAIDPVQALRIDVFRADGAAADRASEVDITSAVAVRLISLEDLVARTARLALDLAYNLPVPAKHAVDFLRLAKFTDPEAVETVWPEHRRPNHPLSFTEASKLLQELIPIRQELLITPRYSTDVTEVCQRCASTSAFQLADASSVLSLLGYC